jgi:hypothetical protein
MSNFYAVTFQDHAGIETVSRFFDTIKAARKWAKWLGQQRFANAVRIMQGGAGGMQVS